MRSRHPDGPWNPESPVEVTPQEYERQVFRWLQKTGNCLSGFEASHLKTLPGAGGEYEFDVVAEFNIFEGAQIVVLVECKRYRNPVKRDTVMTLQSKLVDVGAHKGMLFSTSGFQKGALEYAATRGIATLTFVDGRSIYETRNYGPPIEPPPWIDLPHFAAHHLHKEGKKISVQLIENNRVEAISAWLTENT